MEPFDEVDSFHDDLFDFSSIARDLAAYGKKKYPIDYTVLKVAILTLALLLGVELVRHKIDVLSENRPFFHHVVHLFYHELATLGIVEFGIWLLLTYHPTLNIVQEKLFARVHFMIFYTAILNAVQSVILAVSSFSVSNKLWIQTEKLELGHYVAIRKEFKEVEKKLIPNSEDVDDDEMAEETFNLSRWWSHTKRRIAHPNLARRYDDLLVQVRFHEFRYHFITANELPLKFKVSEYLKRAQVKVLIDLVHISIFAWLSLMGLLNLVYFTMTMVASYNVNKTGLALQVIFLGACALCVIVSVSIVQKVKWIFSRIMHMKLIDSTEAKDEATDSDLSAESTQKNSHMQSVSKAANVKLEPGEQLKLFWLKDPRFITGAIQLMQFGFSLFVSMLLIFWKDVNVKKSTFTGMILSVACFVSWAIYATLMAHVVPRFTLCTCLGQLVNRTMLRECLAKYYLEDALRKRKQQMQVKKTANEMKLVVQESLPRQKTKRTSKQMETDEEFDAERSKHLADLVMTSTENLPTFDELDEEQFRLGKSKGKKKRGVSDGVAIMKMRSIQSSENIVALNQAANNKASTKSPDDREYASDGEDQQKDKPMERRGRKKANSEGVAMMKSPITNMYAERVSEKRTSESVASIAENSEVNFSEEVTTKVAISNDNSGGTMPSLPDARIDHDIHHDEEHEPIKLSKPVVREFLLSGLYRELSSVCGTLFCFFMVSVRMDILLVASGKTKENTTVATIPGSLAFWFEFTWLILFILVSFTTYRLFSRGESAAYETMRIAAVSDILLSSTCLALLVVAESQRTTGTFGSDARTTDGLGSIEPFTALIALRVLRFIFGDKVVAFRKSNEHGSGSVKKQKEVDHHDSHHDHGHGHGHGGHDEKGTAVELWRAAIAHHPDIVDKYGAFSSELLQSMLGLPVVEGVTGEPTARRSSSMTMPNGSGVLTVPALSQDSFQESGSSGPHGSTALQLVQGRYYNLPADTQSIILSGLMQKPMKSIGSQSDGDHKFEFDADRNAMELQEDVDGDLSILVEPNASLIRSMRRCERKAMPFLTKWSVVDVVMTQFEIVLLDATYDLCGHDGDAVKSISGSLPESLTLSVRDIKDECNVEIDDCNTSLRARVCKAIVATEGGKKLRLRDIIAGRKIVGHIDLSTVEVVKVERHAAMADLGTISERVTDSAAMLTEYWGQDFSTKKGDSLSEDVFRRCSALRWARVEEHRLKIQSGEGTMYMRFFSDLEEAEMKTMVPGRMMKRSLQRNDTFLWCQTIGRICGREQLKQKLPHFGDLGDDELNDYLEIVDHSGEEHGRVLSRLRHRVGSVRTLRLDQSFRTLNTETSGDGQHESLPV